MKQEFEWTETGTCKAWRFGRLGCVRETVASSAAGTEVECVRHARDGSREMGQGTETVGLWEDRLCQVYNRVGHNECFRCHQDGRQCQATGGPREEVMGV